MLRTLSLLFLVFPLLAQDVGVSKIMAPSGIIGTGIITPKAQVKNFGPNEESLSVYFSIILIGGGRVYYESAFVSINGNATKNVNFPDWDAQVGSYWTRCSTALAGDVNPTNDTLSEKIWVLSLIPGEWFARESIPLGGEKKKVKDGGALVDGSKGREKLIYALKGGNTREFYLYDALLNQWSEKRPISVDPTNPKNVKKGGSLCKVGDYIYAIKGNNTLEFWAYDIEGDSWIRKRDVLPGPEGKRLKGGSFIVAGKISNHDHIFLIKGGTREFYAYRVANDSWFPRREIPYLEKVTKIKDGSCLIYDREGHLYLLKGSYNELFLYDCEYDTWSPRRPMPLFGSSLKNKKVKNGAAMVYERGQGVIFALKGGGTREFWAYFIAGDSWHELNPIPPGPRDKRVKGGGSLSLTAGQIFALKGGGTNEFWMYTPPAFRFSDIFQTPQVFAERKKNSSSIFTRENISGEGISIYDANGRRIRRGDLKRGLYFLKKERDFIKLVILN